MDELAALKRFRDQIPERDEAARAVAHRRVQATLDELGARRGRPRRRARRVWAVAAAAVAAIVVVSSAFGWTHQLIDFIAGEPAPPRVKRAFALRNEARARAVSIFRESGVSDTLVEQARGVIGINSSVGPVRIWSAPTRGGGQCWLVEIERLRLPDGRPNGGLNCSPYPQPPKRVLEYTLHRTRVGNGYLEYIDGRVREDVTSVELRYESGLREELRVIGGFFLHELVDGAEPVLLIARGERGEEIERKEVRSIDDWQSRLGMPGQEQVGSERTLIRLKTSIGATLTFALARADDGRLCQITRGGGVGRTCGPDPRELVEPDEIAVHPGLNAEGGEPLVTLSGVVGSNVARLELEYASGEVVPVRIVEQFVLVEVPPAHHKDERFVLIGRDAGGDAIARRVIK